MASSVRFASSLRGSILRIFFSCQSANSIGFPSSRLHLIVGFGYPFATHLSVTFKFSLTITSVLVSDVISGGTEIQREREADMCECETYCVTFMAAIFGCSYDMRIYTNSSFSRDETERPGTPYSRTESMCTLRKDCTS